MGKRKENLSDKEVKSSQYRYDAFISYSHSEPDAFIAQKLHAMLEHYHVPKRIRKLSGKKINRIFRDREELPLSSDLAANISEALEQSEFLIVICSPRSMASRWVQKEIETFLMSHKKENVLTLLAEGEPEEAFPKILRFHKKRIAKADGTQEVIQEEVEPMAADVRGENRKEIEKKLKEEFLRILAPMLSCSYDNLRQRHREYRFKKILAAVSGVAIAALLFMGYAFRQAAVLNEQYQEARQNQARYLSKISGELLDQGDRKGAVKTALAITPEDQNRNEPVVPEQMYALNNALYSYHASNRRQLLAESSFELDAQTIESTYGSAEAISEEGTELFCLDELGNAYVVDLESGKCIWKVIPQDLEDYDDGSFLWFGAASNGRAVLISEHEVRTLNWEEKKEEKVIRTEDSFAYQQGQVSCTVTEEYIGIANGLKMWIYRMEDGELLTMIEDNICDMIFYDRDRVAVVKGVLKKGTDGNEFVPHIYTITLYHITEDRAIWTSEYESFAYSVDMNLSDMNIAGNREKVLAVVLESHLLLFRSETGELLQEREFKKKIVGIEKYDEEHYLIGFENGETILCFLGNQLNNYTVSSLDSSVNHTLYHQKAGGVIQILQESRRIVFSKNMEDAHMKSLDLEEKIGEVVYRPVQTKSGEEKVYRCIYIKGEKTSEYSKLYVYEAGTSEKIFEYAAGEKTLGNGIEIIDRKGAPRIIFVERNPDGEEMLITADLETGKICEKQNFTASGEGLVQCIKGFHQSDKILLQTTNELLIGSVTEQGILFDGTEKKIKLKEDESTEDPLENPVNAQITYDDNYIIVENVISQTEREIKVWDVEREKWCALEDQKLISAGAMQFDVGRDSSMLAVYTKEGKIKIYDLKQRKCVQEFFVGYYKTLQIRFMKQDKYLLVCGEDRYLTMWDLEQETIKMQSADNKVTMANTITVDENDEYFALVFKGVIMTEDEIQYDQASIYSVDDKGHFYHYADVPYGDVSFEGNEVFVSRNGGKYAPLYGYQELKERAEKVLGGEQLDEAEKQQYFISK